MDLKKKGGGGGDKNQGGLSSEHQLFSCGLEEKTNVTGETNKYNAITAAIQPCLPLFGNYPDNQGLFSTLTRH